MNVQDIRNEFKQLLKEGKFVTDKSGVKTIEIIGASFTADEAIIFGKENKDYIERELAWYKSQSLNVNDIPAPVPQIWKAVATKDGFINSNYGWCIWSHNNGEQYKHCYEALLRDQNSRRAIMIYTRPEMQRDYNRGGMSDFICTNSVQYFIRDNQLHAVVSLRSNDAVFGYKNDIAWQAHVHEKLLQDLKHSYSDLELGTMHWNAGSLHIYERHFDVII